MAPHIPLHLWSQFDALNNDDTCLQSILLEECKSTDLERFKSSNGLSSTGSSTDKKEELLWTTIGLFGLEEELQRVRWIEEEVSNNMYLCRMVGARHSKHRNIKKYVLIYDIL